MKIIRCAYEEALLTFGANNIGTYIVDLQSADCLCIYQVRFEYRCLSDTDKQFTCSIVNTLVSCTEWVLWFSFVTSLFYQASHYTLKLLQYTVCHCFVYSTVCKFGQLCKFGQQ